MSNQPQPVAVVTGASRGIGKEIALQLARQGVYVFVGCRTHSDGEAVAAMIRAQGGNAAAVSLDVTDADSVAAAAQLVQSQVQQIDVLVNNAGVAIDGFNLDVVQKTLAVNFYGAQQTTDAFLPLLRSHGRIVMLSSGMGDRSALGPKLRARFMSPMTRAELTALLAEFEQAVAVGQHRAKGWPQSAYRVSKIALNVLTETLARDLATDPRKLLVNSCCPGWVRTDMGGPVAEREIDEGADTPVWLAMLPADGPTGGFFRDRAIAEW